MPLSRACLAMPLLALGLAGCVTTGSTSTPPSTTTDKAVQAIQDICRLEPVAHDAFRIAVSFGAVKSQSLIAGEAKAHLAAQAICTSTITDVPSALIAVTNAYNAVMAAKQEI